MPKPLARWFGRVDGLHDGQLVGWAIDKSNPEARVVLEVCLNGEPLATLVADVARTDIVPALTHAYGAAVAFDCCHGFIADLRSASQDQTGRLTIRVANTDAVLTGAIDLEKPLLPHVSATSHVYGDGGLQFHGWVVDATRPQHKGTVRAFIGHQCVGTAQANLLRPTQRAHEHAGHAFVLTLPIEYADAQAHTVRVVDERGTPLNGSPLTVCCHAHDAKALLGETPSSHAQLLSQLIDNYQSYLPRSIGIQHYSQWDAAFVAQTPAVSPALRVALLVWGDTAPEAVPHSLASMKAQVGVKVRVFASQGTKGKTTFQDLVTQALASKCEVLACVRAGDTLRPHGIALALQGFTDADTHIVYTDSEYLGVPWFKPTWSPEYALATDYALELMLFRRSHAIACLEHTALPKNAAELAWTLLAPLWTQQQAIIHVPHVVYQFQSPLSVVQAQQRADAARQALRAIEKSSTLEEVEQKLAHGVPVRRVHRRIEAKHKKTRVSLIIPTRDHVDLLRRCIDSIRTHTTWGHLEIVVIDNGSTSPESKKYFNTLSRQGVVVLHMPGPFNFASLNNRAVHAATGTVVGLINNDIEALHDGWLDEMLSHLLQPGVAAVGAKLLWPNEMVQHGGVLLGIGNVAGHYGNWLHDNDSGYFGRNQVVQRVSAVTAACLLVRKEDYLQVGGMDESAFPVAFNDVDLCLKLRQTGGAIIWTPHAKLLHAESVSRGSEDTRQKKARAQREISHLRAKWAHALLHDPYYHPSLNLDAHSQPFTALALPPRRRAPRANALTSMPAQTKKVRE